MESRLEIQILFHPDHSNNHHTAYNQNTSYNITSSNHHTMKKGLGIDLAFQAQPGEESRDLSKPARLGRAACICIYNIHLYIYRYKTIINIYRLCTYTHIQTHIHEDISELAISLPALRGGVLDVQRLENAMWRLWRRENQKRPCKLIAFVGHTVTEIDFSCLDSFFPFLVSRRLIATGSLNFCVRQSPCTGLLH